MPPWLFFVVAGVSQHAGAALAVLLFDVVRPAGVAWLRVATAAVVLVAWRRPWRRRQRGQWRPVVIAFGVVLALMNLSFYLAIERLPLGTTVAIEFLGPVVVAAFGTRTRRDAAAFVVALAGVGLLADVQMAGSPAGVGFALAAAALWALYIVLGARVARGGQGVDGLAVAMIVGTLAIAPLAAPAAVPAFASLWVAVSCLGVGLLSSVVPYVIDQLVLARTGASRFALLLSLMPAIAAVAGAVVLAQVPTGPELTGIALVIVAVALTGRARVALTP